MGISFSTDKKQEELINQIQIIISSIKEKINDNEEKAIDTQSYTTSEVTRIGKIAFDPFKLIFGIGLKPFEGW